LKRRVTYVAALGFLLLASWSSLAAAQGAASGYEVALHGSPTVLEGRTTRYRGVAYRVLGLAKLQALPGARVRARYGTDVSSNRTWAEVRADKRGFFQIDVPMPKVHQGTPRLEISVGDGKSQRLFRFPLRFKKAWLLDLFMDRQLYEPGESVNVWARLRDARSRRPLAGQRVALTLTGPAAAKRSVVTGPSGVASTTVKIPAQASESSCQVIARIGEREVRRSFRVGTRTYERLFAKVRITPETARPHQAIEVQVKVTTASGAPVRGAAVKVKVDEAESSATTDAKALATLAMHAPAYMTHATGEIPVQVTISHPAHGSARTQATLKLAVPHTLEVEAVPPHGGLAPALDGVLHVRLADGGGEPPPSGTKVEVRGAAIRKGSQRARTDRHGIVTVPTRLPRGAATTGDEGATTTVVVHVKGPAPRTAAIAVPVLRDAEVLPTVSKPVAAPGETLQISLARRASAARVPVIVELHSGKELITARLLGPNTNRVTIAAPKDRLGIIHVLARPLHQRRVVEGTGGVDAFIVRPAAPSFPTLTADRKLYPVKSTARLTLRTAPKAARSWAAVLVRDLAAHAGEYPFQLEFIGKAFDRAILDPRTKAAETLLRTALAAHLYIEARPKRTPELLDKLGLPQDSEHGLDRSAERGVMRDPFPLADELRLRGIGRTMNAIERALARALQKGRLASVTVGRGRARAFSAGLLKELKKGDLPSTLGDGKLTLAMIHAADRSFSYENVARRVGRVRLVQLMVAAAKYLDPGDEATLQQRTAAREPHSRWLPRMVERGLIKAEQLADPWGGSFTLRRTKKPQLVLAVEAAGLELVSPGPDGKLGTRDDLRDPYARAVPAGTPYAVASGEDRLMALLARLSPGQEALRRLLEAFKRVTAEVAEEQTGDAVDASVSAGLIGDRVGEAYGVGGLGLVGHGAGGGGSGSGYGRGSGRLGSRRARAPRISAFAHVVRERFPPTLLFSPAVSVDPSGTTVIKVKLAEAVTTYLVETVVWSADGWTWSAKTQIRVDKETVIDAPVPRHATVGDLLHLPVRVANRTSRPRKLSVSIFAPGDPVALAERKGVPVPAGDAVEVPMKLKLKRASDGRVTVGVRSEAGVALDAVRRQMIVSLPTRRVRRTVDTLASGGARLRLDVPKRAIPRSGAEVTVRVGAGMFKLPPGTARAAWSAAWTGRAPVGPSTMSALRGGAGERLAQAVGTAWAARSVPDRVISRALRKLTGALARRGGSGGDPAASLRRGSQILLRLAPAIRRVGARPGLAADLAAVLRSLRAAVHSRVAATSDDPHLWALAAAALALTAPPKTSPSKTADGEERLSRERELIRRVRRHQIRVGSYTWIATRQNGRATSALLALGELCLDERARALALLSTLGRLEVDGQPTGAWPQTLARVASLLMNRGHSPAAVRLTIDGKAQTVALSGGTARVPAPALARPGRHAIRVEVPGRAGPVLAHVQAVTEYGLPWSMVPAQPGSIVVAIEGKSKGRDQRAELELVVTNRSPRAIATPTLEVNLPAGAELDAEGRAAMRRKLAAEPDATRGTLRLVLAGLPPGGKRRIPLPLRWSVAGKLRGLGVAAYPGDRPEDLFVKPPRVWTIAAPGGTSRAGARSGRVN
jgi:Alpha-2-macroglobulin family